MEARVNWGRDYTEISEKDIKGVEMSWSRKQDDEFKGEQETHMSGVQGTGRAA